MATTKSGAALASRARTSWLTFAVTAAEAAATSVATATLRALHARRQPRCGVGEHETPGHSCGLEPRAGEGHLVEHELGRNGHAGCGLCEPVSEHRRQSRVAAGDDGSEAHG